MLVRSPATSPPVQDSVVAIIRLAAVARLDDALRPSSLVQTQHDRLLEPGRGGDAPPTGKRQPDRRGGEDGDPRFSPDETEPVVASHRDPVVCRARSVAISAETDLHKSRDAGRSSARLATIVTSACCYATAPPPERVLQEDDAVAAA